MQESLVSASFAKQGLDFFRLFRQLGLQRLANLHALLIELALHLSNFGFHSRFRCLSLVHVAIDLDDLVFHGSLAMLDLAELLFQLEDSVLQGGGFHGDITVAGKAFGCNGLSDPSCPRWTPGLRAELVSIHALALVHMVCFSWPPVAKGRHW